MSIHFEFYMFVVLVYIHYGSGMHGHFEISQLILSFIERLSFFGG